MLAAQIERRRPGFNMLFYSSNTASAAAGFWAPLE